MSDQETLEGKLLELLAKIDLAKRYYGYYESHRDREEKEMPGAGSEDFKAALATTPLDFKHSKKENFFSHTERHGSCTLIFNVAFRYSAVEFILSVKTKHGVIGGPYASLAYDVGQLRDPNFSPDPVYPKLPFSNADELREVVQFGVSLFEEVKPLILSEAGLGC